MKIISFATLAILKNFNKALHNNDRFVAIVGYFLTSILRIWTLPGFVRQNSNVDMDQDQEDAPPPQDAAGIRPNQLALVPVLQAQQQPPVEPMDEDVSDIDEEDGDGEDEWSTSYDTDAADSDDDEPKWTRRLTHVFRYAANADKSSTARTRPLYACRPLHLIKCNYKMRNALTSYPAARSGHRIIASESNLYCLGGYNPRSALSASRRGDCLLFQELWCYNFAANHWKLVLTHNETTSMPRELASNALVLHKNVLISHGGTGYPFGEFCSNDCYVYTTGDKPIVARIEVTGDLPIAQYGPGIVIHEDYLYTIGGTTGFDYSCDVYRLNLLTKVWENVYICRPEMRDDPEGRYRHEVVYDGQRIYVLGGGTSNSVYDLQRIPAFNLKSNSWDHIDTLPDRSVSGAATSLNAAEDNKSGYPKPRKCLSCVQHTQSNGDVEAFISGGLQGDFTTYFADIWKLNLRTMQWSWIRGASYPKPLYFHSAAHAGNGCMYVFGGIEYDDKDMRRRNDLYKMWMTVPKLSEMCWDAITYYNENLNSNDSETLLQAGIPDRFVQRLSFNSPRPSRISELFKTKSSLSRRLLDLMK